MALVNLLGRQDASSRTYDNWYLWMDSFQAIESLPKGVPKGSFLDSVDHFVRMWITVPPALLFGSAGGINWDTIVSSWLYSMFS